MKPLSLFRSLVLVGIVGVPLRSLYAPDFATVASEASFAYPALAWLPQEYASAPLLASVLILAKSPMTSCLSASREFTSSLS